jgi:hypothetical protein
MFVSQSFVALLLVAGCSGGKQEVPLVGAQTYRVEPSGKMSVFPSDSANEKQGALPLHHLRVKSKHEGTGAKATGCWRCSDCICNSDDCSCTECTSC